jgi:putative membrane protein
LRRGFVRASLRLFAFGVAPIAYATNTVGAGIAAVFALLFAAWIAWARYRALGYAVFDDYLVARAGVWTRRWWIVPKDRVQTLVMTRDPMQRVSGLATLVIDTAGAAGHSVARIVDLDVDRARSIFDDLLQNAARTSWGGGLVRPPRRNAVPA